MLRGWKKTEEMYLSDKWGTLSEEEIAKTLKRTTNSCRQKARKLGLSANSGKSDLGHQRMKEKASRPADKQERLFMGWVVLKGCCIPGCNKAANFHHEPFRSQGGNHKSGVGLCKFHHQDGKAGRHAMSRERFNETYGVDILELAEGNFKRFLDAQAKN